MGSFHKKGDIIYKAHRFQKGKGKIVILWIVSNLEVVTVLGGTGGGHYESCSKFKVDVVGFFLEF